MPFYVFLPSFYSLPITLIIKTQPNKKKNLANKKEMFRDF